MALFDRSEKSDKVDAYGAPVTAKLVKERYERAAKAMRQERQNYITNKAFVQGDQWCAWEERTDVLRDLPREDSRLRVTLNRLRPASRHLLSKLLSRDLVFEVAPSDTDSATVRGAKTAEAVLSDLHREHKWEQLREQLAWSTWLGGTGVLSIDWDASGGTPLSTLPLTGATVGTGEICESALNILEVAWEPGVRDAERGYWWIRAQALPPDEVQMRYGLKKRPAADAAAASGYLGKALTQREGNAPLDLTLVLTMYERPCKLRPKGCVVTVVGDEVVDGGVKPWPFPWKDRLNIVVFRESKADGRATGDTVFSDAVMTQAAFNQAWSSILEHSKQAGNARLLWPEGSEEIEDLTDLPGEVVTFSQALGKPEWLTPPNLPQWVLDQPDRLAAQMDDQLGYHDVSRGVAPNVESGVGISILVEQDSTPIGALTKEFTQGFERFATMALRLYEVKVKEPRQARIKTPGRTSEVVRWTGASLAGQTIVDIPMDAVMPRSRAAMLSFAERMVSLGIIDPVANPAAFAKIADLPDQANLIGIIDRDFDKTDRMLQLISTLEENDPNLPIPADFDNFSKVIAIMNDFRKTARYESMENWRREYVDAYIQACETKAAEQMGKQVAKQMAHPALAAVPTANAAAPLPEGLALPGAAGGPSSPAPQPPPMPQPGMPAEQQAAPMGPMGPEAGPPADNPLPGTMSQPAG